MQLPPLLSHTSLLPEQVEMPLLPCFLPLAPCLSPALGHLWRQFLLVSELAVVPARSRRPRSMRALLAVLVSSCCSGCTVGLAHHAALSSKTSSGMRRLRCARLSVLCPPTVTMLATPILSFARIAPLRASFSSVMCGGKTELLCGVRDRPFSSVCSYLFYGCFMRRLSALSPVVMADRLTWGMRPEFTHCKLLTSTSVRMRTCHSPLCTREACRKREARCLAHKGRLLQHACLVRTRRRSLRRLCR